MDIRDQYDLLNIPPRLYKYYRYDNVLNEKRLNGEIYLATPFDFNDPCDCQRDIINNTKLKVEEKGEDWLFMKLQELGYTKEEQILLSKSLLEENSIDKYKVYRRQLDKIGILCLTTKYSDTLMWGYYANNDGLCIEYDTQQIIHQIVIGFVNNLDYVSTKFLFVNKEYNINPKKRTKQLSIEQLNVATSYFTPRDINVITNTFLKEQQEQEIIYFLQNIYLKRVAASSIEYKVASKDAHANLFFEKDSNIKVTSKYFTKTRRWAHEKEFRIIVSLGGRQIIKLGPDMIKSIYLGCNTKNEKIVEIAYNIRKLSLNNVKMFKMNRLQNGGLRATSIDISKIEGSFMHAEAYLKKRFKYYW